MAVVSILYHNYFFQLFESNSVKQVLLTVLEARTVLLKGWVQPIGPEFPDPKILKLQ